MAKEYYIRWDDGEQGAYYLVSALPSPSAEVETLIRAYFTALLAPTMYREREDSREQSHDDNPSAPDDLDGGI
jgi:hypothetical protein